jgi:hypothetical protein
MSGDSDWLRREFQRSQATNLDEPCPAPEDLWALTRGELPQEKASQVVLHSSRCARCGAALRIALEMGEPLAPAVAVVKQFPRRRLAAGLGLAAAIAATLVVVPRLRPADTGLHERGGAEDGVRSLVPSTPQARSKLVLQWSAYPGALRYQVTLASTDLHVVFQKQGVTATRVEVPEPALASVPPGAHLVWEVEAILADGRAIKSPAFDLTLQ